MKQLAILSIIFSCLVGSLPATYQENIDRIWDQTVAKVDANHVSGLVSIDLPEKLKKASEEMLPRESLLLTFYPKGSGFDMLIGEEFLDIDDVRLLAEELDMEIEFSCPQRHLAQFEDFNELQFFVKKQFNRELSFDYHPLTFPTKIVTVKLFKR